MTYLWMFLGALALICVMVPCMTGLVRLCAKSFPMSSPVFPVGGLVLTGAYFFLSIPLWINDDLCKPLVGFVALCALFLVQLKTRGFVREICLMGVCFLSALLLPTTLPVFLLLGKWWGYLALGASLYVMMRLFMMMDRVPWFSNLTLLAQGILLMFLIKKGIFTINIGSFLFYAFVATIAVSQTVKVYFGEPVLGEFASTTAGFVLGAVWTFVIAKGYYGVPPILFSYSATEVVLSALCGWFVARRFCTPMVPYFIEQAIDTGINRNRLINTLFLVLCFLSLLGLANLNPNQWGSVVAILVLLLCTVCFQFKRWSVPKVRFRDLGTDLKEGLTELKKEMLRLPLKKDTLKKENTPKKKDTPKKKRRPSEKR